MSSNINIMNSTSQFSVSFKAGANPGSNQQNGRTAERQNGVSRTESGLAVYILALKCKF